MLLDNGYEGIVNLIKAFKEGCSKEIAVEGIYRYEMVQTMISSGRQGVKEWPRELKGKWQLTTGEANWNVNWNQV